MVVPEIPKLIHVCIRHPTPEFLHDVNCGTGMSFT
jgi:hypothetical protein